MSRYVVVSSNHDSSVRVFGAFNDRAKAEALAERVNEKIGKQEDAEFKGWLYKDQDDMAPEGYGRCAVLILHKWNADRAFRFALGEFDS